MPVSAEIRIKLDRQMRSVIATLPSDLQFVLQNS